MIKIIAIIAALAFSKLTLAQEPQFNVAGEVDDVSPSVVGEGETGIMRMTPHRGLHINLRDQNGVAFGTATNPISFAIKADVPNGKFVFNQFVADNQAFYKTYSVAQSTGIKKILAGGTQAGAITLAKLVSATTNLLPGGGFNSNGDIALWSSTGIGASAGLPLNRDTSIFDEGSSSVRITFTASNINNYPEVSYQYSPAIDLSVWRYVSARFYNVRPAGANTTRTILIILEDASGLTRTFSLSGVNNVGTVPFGVTGWVTLEGEILNPTTNTAGFDISRVAVVRLRMFDGANRSNSLWWDNVRFTGAVTPLFKAFFQAGSTFQTTIDPVESFSSGDTLTYIIQNLSGSSGEFSVYSTGVAL
jgi:hypothetical protein